MKKKALLFLLGLLWLSTVSADDVTFAGGVCRPREAGGYELVLPQGTLVINPTWVKWGWDFRTVRDAERSAVVKDGKLVLSFAAVAPADFVTQDDLPMLIVVNGEGKAYPDGLFRLAGSSVASLGMTCVWGYGTTIESDAFKLRFDLDGTRTMSFWNNPETMVWNIRTHTVGEKQADGSTRYAGAITLSESDVTLPKPVDVVAQKRVQYRRVLVPPQERGFDPTRWLALCAEARTNDDFARLEQLMDLRSHLYSLVDTVRHLDLRDARALKQVKAAYTALNEMDVAKAQTAVTDLDARMKELDGGDADRRPLSDFSPYSWIKSFTQWGYVRTPDGHGTFEPTPWNLVWQDGFRCNVDQDPRVAVAQTAPGQNFYETRYLDAMSDVSFERDWVSTRWRFRSGKIVTFSLLTPVVDVDGVTELKMSGFSSAPDSLEMVDNQGRVKWIRLTEEARFVPEVIPSALIDQTKPPPPPEPASTGVAKIDPASVGRPWLRVNIPHARGVILLPESRPTSVAWTKGVLTVTFARKGYVGVLRPPANLYPGEYPEVAEFFARASAAYPVACRETVEGPTRIWRYRFRERTNDWGTEASRLAPVPPLVGFAGLRCKDERAFKYPTKWGLLRYVEGETAVCALPAETPREPASFCGVNSSIWEPIGHELAVVTNGTMGVRLLTTKDKTVEASCEKFEEVLAVYRKLGVKAILDAHNSVYGVWWGDGITPCDDFVAMWDAFSKVGAKYKDVVVGYDLYNEPGTGGGSEEIWRQVCTRAAKAILANHPEAKIYYPALAGGNPNGMANLRPLDLGGAKQVMTYHFYSPHSFTHQKSQTNDVGGDTCVFYPAWAAPIDWGAGHHFGGTTVDWFDKWALGAMLLPAFEHYAQYGVPQHVGEFSVIGYANGRSPRAAYLWTKDAAALFDHVGANWHLWNGGFGLGNEYVRDWFFSRMQKNVPQQGGKGK